MFGPEASLAIAPPFKAEFNLNIIFVNIGEEDEEL